MKKAFCAIFVFLLTLPCALATPVERPHIKVEAVSNFSSITSQSDLKIGLLAQVEEGWHLYWKFAGDSGRPPELRWKSNIEGIRVSDIEWPTPEKIKVGGLTNIGLSGEVLLGQKVITPSINNDISLTLEASWLVCKEECIPGKATLPLFIKNNSQEIKSKHFNIFQNTELLLPLSSTHWTIKQEKKESDIVFTLTASEEFLPKGVLSFIPDTKKQVDLSVNQVNQKTGDSILLRIPFSASAEKERKSFSGIILSSEPDFDGKNSLSVNQSELSFQNIEVDDKNSKKSFGVLILLAFLGGLLLNLMPCVFPILSIKVLSLVKGCPIEHRHFGTYFTLGVLTSFSALGMLFLGLKAAGATIGWGFQFQHPEFVVGISILLTLVALNFLGVFEIGYTLQSKAGAVPCGKKARGAFLSGVLATVVATPCTAPFMGVAIAATVSRTAFEGFLIFIVMGLGMALPYILFAFIPGFSRLLPKPGAWMETFKQFLAFPVLATVVWLIDVFAKQTSISSAIQLVLCLLIISFAAWIYGKAINPNSSVRKKRILFFISWSIGLLVTTLMIITPHSHMTEEKGIYVDAWGQSWQTYSKLGLEKAIQDNKKIYVDFTAAWCITCQVNKRVVFSSDEVRKYFKDNSITLIRGDWTLMDSEISKALEEYQREGVPLNVVIVPGKRPQVLPSVLTPSIVINAFNG